MVDAFAWLTRWQRWLQSRSGRLLGYLWLSALACALLLSAQYAYQRALSVEEYAFACDPFGYLRMAREVRQAVSNLALPHFHLESPQTRLLIDLMQSREVPLGLWEEMVAPHAHHYFPQAGSVGVQYPPGTGLMLALFPEGQAVDGLNQATIALLLVTGFLVLILAGKRQAWVPAGFVTMALYLGLVILRKIGTDSFSINAALAALLLGFLCIFAALALRSWPGRDRVAWVAAFVGGCLLGFAILIRLPIIFLLPGLLMLLWPQSWRPSIRDLLMPFSLGIDGDRYRAAARTSIPHDGRMVPSHLWECRQCPTKPRTAMDKPPLLSRRRSRESTQLGSVRSPHWGRRIPHLSPQAPANPA